MAENKSDLPPERILRITDQQGNELTLRAFVKMFFGGWGSYIKGQWQRKFHGRGFFYGLTYLSRCEKCKTLTSGVPDNDGNYNVVCSRCGDVEVIKKEGGPLQH